MTCNVRLLKVAREMESIVTLFVVIPKEMKGYVGSYKKYSRADILLVNPSFYIDVSKFKYSSD